MKFEDEFPSLKGKVMFNKQEFAIIPNEGWWL